MHSPKPPSPHVPLHYPTRCFCHARNRKASHGTPQTSRNQLGRESQRQPQHADLAATTLVYTATLEQSRFLASHVEYAHLRDKSVALA